MFKHVYYFDFSDSSFVFSFPYSRRERFDSCLLFVEEIIPMGNNTPSLSVVLTYNQERQLTGTGGGGEKHGSERVPVVTGRTYD